jgi:hypothetical protein
MTEKERAARYRARKRGEDVPKRRPGPRVGFKQSVDHIEKRKRWGAEHHAWAGDDASVKAGRARALRAYPDIGPCEKCNAAKSERHHVDGNTLNNEPGNIMVLCRRCHMEAHGRIG